MPASTRSRRRTGRLPSLGELIKKGYAFFDEGVSLRSAPRMAMPACDAHSAQSVFCGVHAAAKNGFQLIRGFRAANSVRRLLDRENARILSVLFNSRIFRFHLAARGRFSYNEDSAVCCGAWRRAAMKRLKRDKYEDGELALECKCADCKSIFADYHDCRLQCCIEYVHFLFSSKSYGSDI